MRKRSIEAAIDESCEKAMSLEKAGSKTDADHTEKINVQCDIRWGNEDITRQALVLLSEKKRVVAFGTRNTSCRTCNIAERKGKEAKSHDCRKN